MKYFSLCIYIPNYTHVIHMSVYIPPFVNALTHSRDMVSIKKETRAL